MIAPQGRTVLATAGAARALPRIRGTRRVFVTPSEPGQTGRRRIYRTLGLAYISFTSGFDWGTEGRRRAPARGHPADQRPDLHPLGPGSGCFTRPGRVRSSTLEIWGALLTGGRRSRAARAARPANIASLLRTHAAYRGMAHRVVPSAGRDRYRGDRGIRSCCGRRCAQPGHRAGLLAVRPALRSTATGRLRTPRSPRATS